MQLNELLPNQAVASTSKLPVAMPSSSKKPFMLPGHERATRKKLGKANDLLSGVSNKAVDLGFEDQDDAEEEQAAHSDKRTARDTASSSHSNSSLPVQDFSATQRGKNASLHPRSEDTSMQIDEALPPNEEKEIRRPHRLPSPAPSTSTTASTSQLPVAADISIQTPTKQRRIAHLATPTSSNKKRTPTKAVKKKAEEKDDFLSAPSTSFTTFPTPSTTPDRSPQQTASYPTQDILSLLQKVLEQLSSPCASISTSCSVKPGNPEYRTWLASQPCLSPAHAAAEKDVRNTLDRTIRDGEGNCMLVIGERGIGKSAIVERSLKTLENVYRKDAFLTVKLSGLVQRDDKAAVREIARQLCSSSYSEEVEEGSSFVSRPSTSFKRDKDKKRLICNFISVPEFQCQHSIFATSNTRARPIRRSRRSSQYIETTDFHH